MRNHLSSQTKVEQGTVLEKPVKTMYEVNIRRNCRIGSFTMINDHTTIFPQTTIGRFCSIGKMCEIGAPSHPTDRWTSSPITYNLRGHFRSAARLFAESPHAAYRPTFIGADVWIGSHVIVVAGVKIGTGAIIAGGAVVTKDVAEYEIVGGIPAVHKSMRFDADIRARLLAAEWWNLPFDQMSRIPATDIRASLSAIEQIRREVDEAGDHLSATADK